VEAMKTMSKSAESKMKNIKLDMKYATIEETVGLFHNESVLNGFNNGEVIMVPDEVDIDEFDLKDINLDDEIKLFHQNNEHLLNELKRRDEDLKSKERENHQITEYIEKYELIELETLLEDTSDEYFKKRAPEEMKHLTSNERKNLLAEIRNYIKKSDYCKTKIANDEWFASEVEDFYANLR
jgi:hypothetical protein